MVLNRISEEIIESQHVEACECRLSALFEATKIERRTVRREVVLQQFGVQVERAEDVREVQHDFLRTSSSGWRV